MAMLTAPISTRLASRPSLRCRQPVRQRQPLSVHASDAFCKDVVNLRASQVQGQGIVYKVTLLASAGEARVIEVPDDQYILEAAAAAGVDLPATCRGGICGACVARVAKGEVDQSDIADLSFTLTDEEVAAGMALLCMSRAKSDMEIETQCDWGYSLGVGEWKGATGRFSAEPDPLMGQKLGQTR